MEPFLNKVLKTNFEIDFVEQGAISLLSLGTCSTDQEQRYDVNLSVQSKFLPDEPFGTASKVDFLDKLQQENEDTQSFASRIYGNNDTILKGWFWVILSVIVSFLIFDQ